MTTTIELSYIKELPIEIEYLEKQYQTDIDEPAAEVQTQPYPELMNQTAMRYNPFKIRNIQNYNPLYSRFFQLTDHNYNKITLNQRYGIHKTHLVNRTTGKVNTKLPVFFKFAPLLDPVRYMVGKYDLSDPAIRTLPTVSTLDKCHPKLTDVNNVSYVDSFFCYLSSQLLAKHNVFNALDFYGSYSGIQELFRVDVSDEMDYLQSSPFYLQHVNREFFVDNYEYANYNKGSKTNRQRIQIKPDSQSSRISLDAEVLDKIEEVPQPICDEVTETVYEKSFSKKSASGSSNESYSTQNSQEIDYSTDDDDSADENEDNGNGNDNEHVSQNGSENMSDESLDAETESDVSEMPELYAYIPDFPTQMICIEKCDGVLDDLLSDDEMDEDQMAACLFQIVMTLLVYKKAFHFTHNDLHTNNIMYINTDQQYVYYRFQSKYYRVPTYGRIYKIIDFGRSIYRFRGELFCSDSFAKSGDAYSQYNCEPFMNEDKPRIDPNPSFDLCRLGCSIYDFILDSPDGANDKLTPTQKTIMRWCTDDNGRNILYKKTMEERYPGFKLYKMIARNVHRHTPEAQLSFEYFWQFEISKKNLSKHIQSDSKNFLNIDEIPSYVDASPK
jgi:hypothetical protein